MPNWCDNSIMITASCEAGEKELKHLKENCSNMVGDKVTEWFSLIKLGVKEEDMGAKWDACESWIDNNSDPNRMLVDYQSPWGPHIEGLIKLSEIYPHLEFYVEYYEPGCGVLGNATMNNGCADVNDIDINSREGQIKRHSLGDYNDFLCYEEQYEL